MTLAPRRKGEVAKLLADELATHGGRCCFCNKQLHTPVWHHQDGELKDANVSDLAHAGDLDGLRRELSRCGPAHTSCHNQHHRDETMRRMLHLKLAN